MACQLPITRWASPHCCTGSTSLWHRQHLVVARAAPRCCTGSTSLLHGQHLIVAQAAPYCGTCITTLLHGQHLIVACARQRAELSATALNHAEQLCLVARYRKSRFFSERFPSRNCIDGFAKQFNKAAPRRRRWCVGFQAAACEALQHDQGLWLKRRFVVCARCNGLYVHEQSDLAYAARLQCSFLPYDSQGVSYSTASRSCLSGTSFSMLQFSVVG